MTIDPRVFKAYDVRGLYPEEVDEDGAERIGAAFIALTGAKRVAVGHDVRLSSPSVAARFAEGALAAGADVIELGLCATEMLYFAVADGGLDAGACITASHNPPQYTRHEDGHGRRAAALGRRRHRRGGPHRPRRPPARGHARHAQPRRQPAGAGSSTACMGFVDPSAIRDLRVVLDAANGMAGLYLPPVLDRLSIDAVPYFLDPDGRFPNHEPNPLLPENREFIIGKVREDGGDLGIAFDGDADRCFFIDDTGEFVAGDFLTALLATHLMERAGPSTIVYDLRASWAVRDAVEAAGGTADMYRVGHAFIKTRMREVDALFARRGQRALLLPRLQLRRQRPHPGAAGDGDGRHRGVPLSEMIAGFRERYHISGEINSTVDDVAAALQRLRDGYADGRQIEIDGLSVEYRDWHFNVRPSNTEPLLRLNLESLVSEEDMERKRDEVLEVIRSG